MSTITASFVNSPILLTEGEGHSSAAFANAYILNTSPKISEITISNLTYGIYSEPYLFPLMLEYSTLQVLSMGSPTGSDVLSPLAPEFIPFLTNVVLTSLPHTFTTEYYVPSGLSALANQLSFSIDCTSLIVDDGPANLEVPLPFNLTCEAVNTNSPTEITGIYLGIGGNLNNTSPYAYASVARIGLVISLQATALRLIPKTGTLLQAKQALLTLVLGGAKYSAMLAHFAGDLDTMWNNVATLALTPFNLPGYGSINVAPLAFLQLRLMGQASSRIFFRIITNPASIANNVAAPTQQLEDTGIRCPVIGGPAPAYTRPRWVGVWQNPVVGSVGTPGSLSSFQAWCFPSCSVPFAELGDRCKRSPTLPLLLVDDGGSFYLGSSYSSYDGSSRLGCKVGDELINEVCYPTCPSWTTLSTFTDLECIKNVAYRVTPVSVDGLMTESQAYAEGELIGNQVDPHMPTSGYEAGAASVINAAITFFVLFVGGLIVLFLIALLWKSSLRARDFFIRRRREAAEKALEKELVK